MVIDTSDETGFKVTVEQLEAARTQRTKVLLFVSPDNPEIRNDASEPPRLFRRFCSLSGLTRPGGAMAAGKWWKVSMRNRHRSIRIQFIAIS